jgi:hypothetical protein
MLRYNPLMAVLQTFDLVGWDFAHAWRRQKPLHGIGACEFLRQRGRRMKYHMFANRIAVARPSQDCLPGSPFAASSPSSISRLAASARGGRSACPRLH